MVVPLLLLVLLSGSSSGNSSSSSSNNYKYLMQVEILLVGKLEGNDSYEEPMEAGHLDKFQTADMYKQVESWRTILLLSEKDFPANICFEEDDNLFQFFVYLRTERHNAEAS